MLYVLILRLLIAFNGDRVLSPFYILAGYPRVAATGTL
jgi:hypothetical protein